MISAASIKSILKNLSIKEKSTMQNELVTYALERTIYRMSISKYRESYKYKNTLIEIDINTIKLTNKGIDLANIVWEEFI